MKKSNNKGITLIALVITIIVLLILAIVTLNFVLGDSGIISKAQVAKEKTNLAKQEEEEKLNELENYVTSNRINGNSKFECIYENTEFTQYSDPSTQYSLTKPFTDFDFIIVYGKAIDATSFGRMSSTIICTSDIELSDSFKSNGEQKTTSTSFDVFGGGTPIAFYFPSTTSFKIRKFSICSSYNIKNIWY